MILIIFASGQPIIWTSSRQLTVTHSSTEAEYIAADTGTKTMTWLSNLADELKLPVKTKTELRIDNKPETKYHDGNIISDTKNDLHLLVDNKGAFVIAHAHGPSKRTKHLDVRYHYMQEQVNNNVIRLTLVPTTEQYADFLTKAVGPTLFKQAMKNIGFPVS